MESSKSTAHPPGIGIGIMSGTSLDGLDLALCQFSNKKGYELIHFEEIPYPDCWLQKLKHAPELNGLDLKLLENEYSIYIANQVEALDLKTNRHIDFIGCHGHTIFHQPENAVTLQLCNGNILAAKTGITTVCDFRSADVALGGQGAPLVPIGDDLLFQDYAACLNLGGIANISFDQSGKRLAYDICPANMLLNTLANRLGQAYDSEGALAKTGEILPQVLEQMNALDYYYLPPPKSLGREWFDEKMAPLLLAGDIIDLLATSVAHIINQLSIGLEIFQSDQKILVTGGGAFNTYLIQQLKKRTTAQIIIPDRELIAAKEAIVFALLAKLRLENKVNTLASVTGAERDSSGGAVYTP